MAKTLLVDLDGTLIDTPHYEAWRNVASKIGVIKLSVNEYIDNIAGRPREEGAARLLALVKKKEKNHMAGRITATELANLKQVEFLGLAEKASLFGDAVRLLKRCAKYGQKIIFYTASQNAPLLLVSALHDLNIIFEGGNEVVQQRSGQTRRELFESLLSECTTEDVDLIDDAPYAVDTACALGINAIQVHRHTRQAKCTNPRASVISSLDEYYIA